MTILLIKLYWKMAKESFLSAGDNAKFGFVLAAAAGIVLTIFFGFVIGGMAPFLPEASLGMIFSYSYSVLLGVNLLFGVPQVFNHLYGTKDLAFLFTLPLKPHSIFRAKFIQSFIGLPFISFLISCIFLTIFGAVRQESFIFFAAAYFLAFSTILLGLSLSYLLNLLLIRIIPAHRAKELMTVMSVLSGLILYTLFQLPNLLSNSEAGASQLELLPELPIWMPAQWASISLTQTGNGSVEMLIPLALTLLVSAVMLIGTFFLIEKGFRSGWVKMNEGGRTKKKKSKSGRGSVLYHPVMAAGLKEWRTIQRDMREWVSFLPFVFFMIFPLFTLFSNKEMLNIVIESPMVSWLLAQGCFLFVGVFLSAGFASSSIGREGHSINLLKLLPLSGLQIALGKFWINWLVPFSFIFILEIGLGIFLHWPAMQVAFGILNIGAVNAGITALGLYLGTTGSKYNPDNPQNRLETGVSFLMILLSFIYLACAAFPSLIAMIPLYPGNIPSQGLPGFISQLSSWKEPNFSLITFASLCAAIAVSGITAGIFLKLSARRIEKGVSLVFSENK